MILKALRQFTKEVGFDLKQARELQLKLESRYSIPEESQRIEDYYTNTVVPHKVAVFKAGWELRYEVDNLEKWIWQLLEHDLSKFSQEESAYAYYLFNGDHHPKTIQNFRLAWHHHKHHNPHHPEYWFSVGKKGDTYPLDMPNEYIVEMLADWVGAGQVYGNTLEEWLPDNLHTFWFSKKTSARLKDLLWRYFKIDTTLKTNGLCVTPTPNS